MKKSILLILSITLIVSMFGIQAFAETDSAKVFVTISKGTLALAQEKITVTDTDGDGILTINDALYAAHEAKYPGGAAAGYGTAKSDIGLGITKLWGVENGGSYGYYINNAGAMALTDAIKDGDYITAYVITDTAAWSDSYCFFSLNSVSAKVGESFTLTLSAIGFDENWAPVVNPVEGAVITIDGIATSVKTNVEGKAVIKLDEAKIHVISATSETAVLVPPVCIATAEIANPQTSDNIGIFIFIIIMLLSGIIFTALRRKDIYEK